MGKLTTKPHHCFNSFFCAFVIMILTLGLQVNNAFAIKEKFISEVHSYLQNIKTAAINFEQSDSDGNKARGVLVISKPHKFRVNYFKPFPLLIVGNSNYISIYDYEMDNISRISAKENIFNFLLTDKIEFGTLFEITEAVQDNHYLKIKVHHLESGNYSNIVFDRLTKTILSMEIVEENNIISLKFSNYKNLNEVNDKLFIMQDPNLFGKPLYLDEKLLEKYYK